MVKFRFLALLSIFLSNLGITSVKEKNSYDKFNKISGECDYTVKRLLFMGANNDMVNNKVLKTGCIKCET